VSPVGAIATGIATFSPSIVVASLRSLASISTRWRKRIALRSSQLARWLISS
jgi:hypothetical protein